MLQGMWETGVKSRLKLPTKNAQNHFSGLGHTEIMHHIRTISQKMLYRAAGSHDWEHTLRVHRLCERIGPSEGADMEVLSAAAYLHDIGRHFQDVSEGSICHAEKGAELAKGIVMPLPFSKTQKLNIIHAVRSHRFRGDHRPQSIEAKVLFDADKLDAIGAVGVARAFLFAGEVGAQLHNPDVDIEKTRPYSRNDTGFREFKVKLIKIRERIQTQTGKEMADDRHLFMEDFFKRFQEEYEGRR